MTEIRKRRTRRFVWLALAMLPMLYPLSIGPAFWMYWHGYTSMPTVRTLFAPVFWIHGNSESLASCVDWYLNLWSPV